jgi:plastocyanin
MSAPSHGHRACDGRGVFGRGGLGRGIAIVWFAVAALAASATIYAGDSVSPSGAGTAPTSYSIEIRNFAFTPKALSVPAGARVVWTNHDEEPHLIVSVGGAFKPSPALDTDDSFAAVLTKPGTYEYYCGMHPIMVGRIVVH